MHIGLSDFCSMLGCFIIFVRLYVLQKDFLCGSSISTLKSPKINIFLYFEELSLINSLMLPDGSLSWIYEDYRNNYQLLFIP